jgi:hypothetical protein
VEKYSALFRMAKEAESMMQHKSTDPYLNPNPNCTAGFMAENQEEWCNADLLGKLAQKPELMKMLENPQVR